MADLKKEMRLHGGRDRITIRVKPELKEALSRFCEVNGLSLCHVFEALATGYLTGMKQKIDWVSQSPTIELSVVREVKRIRRYAKEEFPENFYCEGKQINDLEAHHRRLARWKRSQLR